MPSHKAKFKWRKSAGTWEATPNGGGIMYEERACSRGGVFVCKLIRTHALTLGSGMKVSGRWALVRPDGSTHSQGTYDSWTMTGTYPDDAVLERVASGE